MNLTTTLLGAITGGLRGQQIAQDRQYGMDQDAQARADRLAQQQALLQRQQSEDAYRHQQDALQNANTLQQAQLQAATAGYDSAPVVSKNANQLDQVGKQLAPDPETSFLSPYGQLGQLLQTGSSMARDQAQNDPTFQLGGVGYTKTRLNPGEQAREDNNTAKRDAQQAALAQAKQIEADKIKAHSDDVAAQIAGRSDLATLAASLKPPKQASPAEADAYMTKFDAEVKPLKEQYTTFRNTTDQLPAALAGDAAAQTAVLNNFIRAMHPKGTPRESERKMIAAAAPLMDRVSDQLSALATRKGYVVPRSMLNQMATIIDQAAGETEKSIKDAQDRWTARAKAAGISRDPGVMFDAIETRPGMASSTKPPLSSFIRP